MKKTVIEYAFTSFVIALIVLPLPPSTIIGIALATNPKTGKYMNKTAFKLTQKGTSLIAAAVVFPAKRIAAGKQIAAQSRIKSGIVRL